MKILLASQDCQLGGVATFMVALAESLSTQGHQCELFFFEHGPMEQQLPSSCVGHYGDLADCIRLINSECFDVVHGNSGDWQIGFSAVRIAGAKLIVTAHGWVVPNWNSYNCDGFVCCSRWQAEEQKRYTDLPIHTILNGIDTDKFKPAEDTATSPPIVAWVGRARATREKRIDKLAAIAPALRRVGLRLWIADPYSPDEAEKVAPEAARTLLSTVDFWGMVPSGKMADFYREVAASGGCVLSTSSSEGLPMNLIEAQACGCPVIGPDVRGVNEVINPAHGGVLYEFGTEPEQLASLVIETLTDKERMQWRRAASAQYVRERFSLPRMAQEYVRVYEEAMARLRSRQIISRRAQQWLEPLLHWDNYVAGRWAAGCSHYEASRRLAEQGEWALAAAAARLSLVTSPTIYVRPQRLAHLLKTLFRPGSLWSSRDRSPANGRSQCNAPKEVD